MATVEEVMAQALAAEQLAEEEWTKVYSYKIKAQYTDTDVAVDVRKREIGDVRENVSTIDENNAQYISFIMDRYCDGVDLTGMRIQIQYQVSEGVGSINAPVNVCYNSSQIRFGWIVPKAATQTNEIKVIVACVGNLADGSTYELKTKPVVYNIADTLRLGSDVPQPDENWYLQFVTIMDEKVANALKSANDAAQSAMQANESLSAVQQVQADVDASKETVQTLAQQVQDNTVKSKNSADAAKASEEAAKSWAERAQELSGVSYASKELAGIVAPQDVYVNPENGHMSLITRTTDKTLTNSYSGGIKINEVYGKSEQKQYSGYNLLDFSNAKGGSNVGVTVAINADGSYSYVGTPTDNNVNVWLLGSYVSNTPILTLAPGKYYVKGVNLCYNSTNIFTGGRNGGFITLTEETPIAGVRAVSGVVGTSYNETWYPIIAKSDVEVPWEPYVGGIPSPNPDYPQEIKSVVNPTVKVCGKNLLDINNPTKAGYVISNDNTFVENALFNCYRIKMHDNGMTISWVKGSKFDAFRYGTEKDGIITRFTTQGLSQTIKSDGVDAVWISIIPEDDVQSEIMVSAGTDVVPYIPYTEQTVTLPYTLRGIGDVKDRIIQKDGVWGVDRKFKEFKLKDIISSLKLSSTTRFAYTVGLESGMTYGNILSENFISQPVNSIDNGSVSQGIGIQSDGNIHFRISDFTTKEEYLEYFTNNEGKFIYELATPTFEPLLEADQIALNSLLSFDTVTYISTDSEVEPVIDLEYGTSKVGAYTLECYNDKEVMKLEIAAMKAAQTTTEEIVKE